MSKLGIIKICFIAILVSLTAVTFAQENTFQRLFTSNPGNKVINQACAEGSSGSTYIAGYQLDLDSTQITLDSSAIIVAHHDVKGILQWSNTYRIDDLEFDYTNKSLSIDNIGNGQLLVTVHNNRVENDDSRYFFLLNSLGTVIQSTSKIVFNTDMSNAGITSVSDILIDTMGRINYFGSNASNDTIGVQLRGYDTSFITEQSISYYGLDQDTLPVNIELADSELLDSSMMVIANLSDSEATALFELDYDGVVLTGQEYAVDTTVNHTLHAISTAATLDTGVVTLMHYEDGNDTLAIVNKTDSLNQIEWSMRIGGLDTTVFIIKANDILVSPIGHIVVSGKVLNATDSIMGDFTIFMDQDGEVLHQNLYNSVNAQWIDADTGDAYVYGELVNATDGQIHYTTTGLGMTPRSYNPILIKMDVTGSATCQDTLDAVLVRPINMVMDTFILATSDFASDADAVIDFKPFGQWDITTLQLKDVEFCPNDDIDFLIEGTTPGATAYLWSTGDTTPTLRVFEEGEYSLIVTIEDRICYSLCDTSTVAVLDPSSASASAREDICDFILAVGGGNNRQACTFNDTLNQAPAIPTFIWSTGDSTSTSRVDQEINYQVTITDGCGDTYTTDITTERSRLDAALSTDNSRLCDSGTIDIFLIPNSTNRDLDTIIAPIWNDGTPGDTLTVDDVDGPGTYSLTLVDICGEEETFSRVLTEEDFDLSFMLSIEPDFERQCEGIIELIVRSSEEFTDVAWSTNETNDTIQVTQGGEYAVSVTSICDIEMNASIPLQPSLFLPPTVEIMEAIDDTLCQTTLTAIVTPNRGIQSQVWSTGETELTIISEEIEIYSIIDICNVAIADTSVVAGIDSLEWPNIFFPDSRNNIPENLTFGPKVDCPQNIVEYNLEIFNRWGKRVYQSTRIDAQRWTGSLNNGGERMEEEVYMWQVSYTDATGVERTDKGHVTMIRR